MKTCAVEILGVPPRFPESSEGPWCGRPRALGTTDRPKRRIGGGTHDVDSPMKTQPTTGTLMPHTKVFSVLSVSPWVFLCLAGCVERRIHITSEPTGAMVSLNDVDVGSTPCEVDFTYFGVYDVRLKKPGFEPLVTKAEAKAPFHEWPLVDLAAMLVPVRKRTRIDWHFVLEPADNDPARLRERAEALRQELGSAPAPPE